MRDGLELFDRVGHGHQRRGAFEQLAAKVRAQTVAHDRHVVLVNNAAKLAHVIRREELGLVEQYAIKALVVAYIVFHKGYNIRIGIDEGVDSRDDAADALFFSPILLLYSPINIFQYIIFHHFLPLLATNLTLLFT